jgi:hypothetical protein
MDVAANAPQAGDDTLWHALPTADVVERLATSVDKGLDAGEAKTRPQNYGPNRLPEGRKRGPFMPGSEVTGAAA